MWYAAAAGSGGGVLSGSIRAERPHAQESRPLRTVPPHAEERRPPRARPPRALRAGSRSRSRRRRGGRPPLPGDPSGTARTHQGVHGCPHRVGHRSESGLDAGPHRPSGSSSAGRGGAAATPPGDRLTGRPEFSAARRAKGRAAMSVQRRRRRGRPSPRDPLPAADRGMRAASQRIDAAAVSRRGGPTASLDVRQHRRAGTMTREFDTKDPSSCVSAVQRGLPGSGA